ncbi:DUF6412 domain-containing protein [Phytohabitans rumicis]|uniref:Uncharacterized protein n=1 Tax=Phytohabitans rumicis TaxID=1076125 RepID=A0A6V8L2W6_9ACTN|nr:DUF6412 domain-containing protein [Phytohabitans rumicis]GFJ90494.1 hypothetical protein Prum_041360 [Phytohabitans rumicis]
MPSVLSLCAYVIGLFAGGTSSTELIAGAALAAVSLLAIAVSFHVAAGRLPGTGRPARLHSAAVREHTRGARLPRLRDPDAAGRARPRAPSARPSAA